MATITFTLSVSGASLSGSATVSAVNSVTGTGVVLVDAESIANGQTAFEINLDLDQSAMKGLWMYSDQTITIETNDSGTPDDTITLTGGIPKIFYTNGPANPLSADVDTIFVANSSGSTATLTIIAIQDATP